MTPEPTSRAPSAVGLPTRLILLTLGALTATPALVLIDPGQLASYGIEHPDAPTLAVLRHRGVLQLLLGAALVLAALRPRHRRPVLLGALLAKGSFLALVLGDPAVREGASPVGPVFDGVSIVLLAAILLRGARAGRRDASGA